MRRIELYDTTLRDGAQGEGINFSLQDKLAISRRLDDIGFDYVEGGYPASNEKDRQYFQRIRQTPLSHIKICAFGMTRRKGASVDEDSGLQALLDSQAATITLVGKASPFQVAEVLQTTLDENLEMIGQSVEWLIRAGREVIFDAEHFYDAWKEDRGYAMQAVQAAVKAGARLVTLCDTNGGSMTDEATEITGAVASQLSVPVGVHFHNDCDLAVANSLAAVEAGASLVQGTINGFGERCGNADLISVAANLAVKRQGYEVLKPGGIARLTELSRFLYESVNMSFRSNQPFVGKSAFAHKGGMHVSAIARNTASYEHVDPDAVGNQRRVLVSELSGRSNIVATAAANDPNRVLAEIVAKENAGYQFEAADASYQLLVQRCNGTFQPHFETLHYDVTVDNKVDGEVRAEAIVKIRVEGRDYFEAAEGHGPIDALNAALRKALNGRFPGLNDLHLVDYKVRVINSEAATAAKVRVLIQSEDNDEDWGTVGVDENIIQASWIALLDSFEYKLWKDEKKSPSPAGKGDPS
ncbi:MAG: citramalate synthase [Thermoguttaceae bacterium]